MPFLRASKRSARKAQFEQLGKRDDSFQLNVARESNIITERFGRNLKAEAERPSSSFRLVPVLTR